MMNKVIERFTEDELTQDTREQHMIAQLVDADSTDEQIELVAEMIDLGMPLEHIKLMLRGGGQIS